MTHDYKNPAACSDAGRVGVEVSFDEKDPTTGDHFIQAIIISHRHRLSPVRARLTCHLAGIGGRFA